MVYNSDPNTMFKLVFNSLLGVSLLLIAMSLFLKGDILVSCIIFGYCLIGFGIFGDIAIACLNKNIESFYVIPLSILGALIGMSIYLSFKHKTIIANPLKLPPNFYGILMIYHLLIGVQLIFYIKYAFNNTVSPKIGIPLMTLFSLFCIPYLYAKYIILNYYITDG